MINLTAKKIQLAIKNGQTLEELSEKCDITIEDLENQIKRIYSAGDGSMAKQAIKNLKANRKKAKKVKETEPAEDIASEVPTEPVEGTASAEPVEKTLEELKNSETFLVSMIIQHETTHKELSSQHRVCIKELRSLQERMEEIKKNLEEAKRSYDSVTTKADEIALLMNEISSQRRKELEALERVRQEITDKTTIVIYVYSDGAIEAPESPEFIIDDEGYLDLKSEISEREECLDLRVRDITTLARLIKICEQVEHLTLICENEELEKAFWIIRN